ncbi:MAG TPA: cytochrome ubiquinol oxidase subunit I [Pseudonocardia sp.]|jgi:cytochrome d ubiquinol oxidase subunit I
MTSPTELALLAETQPYLLEARQLQALSFIVHIPFVCFGIAFPVLVLYAEWQYLRTGDVLFLTLAKRWSKVLITLFTAGVVTGTVLSFEMGSLWPEFTATFGGVFGLAFALEGFSFFAEAIFIGIYVYGWSRLSPKLHFASGVPIACTGLLGSFMVIAVNGWMNHPEGFRMINGRVSDVQPVHALFLNGYFWHEFIHMYIAGFMVTGFLLAGPYALARLRGRWTRYERTALAVPLTAAAIASPLQILVGDWAARDVAAAQPVKLAALEGLGTTTRGAPEHLLGYYTDGRVVGGIEIPRLLSLLAEHNPNAVIKGLDTVPVADQPPVNLVRFAFQTMTGIGSLLALLSVIFLVIVWRRGRLPNQRWFYPAVAVAGPLAYLALIAGWLTTEVGRQPWVVYGIMRTEQAVTGAAGIPVGYGVLAGAYALLLTGAAVVLTRLARVPLPDHADPEAA